MNRKNMLVIGGIIFFLVLYVAISYWFFQEAVINSEKHTIQQTRVALRETSDRMGAFLEEQCQSLKVLPLFREIRECVASGDYSFMHQTSVLSLNESQVFVVLDKNAKCVMVETEQYQPLLLNKQFAREHVAMFAEQRPPHLISKAILIHKDETEQYFIFVFHPVYESDGSIQCVFGLGFNVESLFNNFLKPLEANYDGAMVCVTDRDGNIEVFSDSNLIKKNASLAAPSFLPPIPRQLVEDGFHGSYVWETDDGGGYLIIYHPVVVDSHVLVAQYKIPYSNIKAALAPLYWKLLVLFVVLVLIALIGIFAAITADKQIRLLKNRINTLEIQIDQEKKAAAVEEITSSDYFQNLQQQAERLKKIN